MKNRIAIIGSNSFSGAAFAAHCLKLGLEVLGLSRSAEPAACFLPYRWLSAAEVSRFRYAQSDLNHDLAKLMSELDSFQPALVVNFAAQGMVAQSWQTPEDWYQTNVLGNVKFHDQLRRRTYLEKYVHVGTPEVYGNTTGTITESAPFNPSTPYAASRAACDLHLRTFVQHYQFPVVWTRAANVYGAGQQLYRIIPRTILMIKLGQKLNLHGGGVSVRSFIHIDDVADATLRAANVGKAGDCFHLSTDRFISIRALVEMICVRLKVNFDEVVDVAPERPGKDAAYLLDSTRARTELGWKDQITLEAGIESTIDWMNREFEEIRRQPFDYIHKP
ncbi:MAG: GDP-mannose 4,6-dehydratase [Opitutaceae bacterium]|nr:GDP-mannose 4,6-dehydratase [Opitutaceae bacterium]